MPINFIVNDPLAVDSVPMRSKDALGDRKSSQAGFTFVEASPAGIFAPGTSDFLFWQSREAALTAIQVWEALNGPLTQWGPETANPAKLALPRYESFGGLRPRPRFENWFVFLAGAVDVRRVRGELAA